MEKLGYKMTASSLMASNAVIVNEGSGVLVNAMTQDYSYVLTAKHVLAKSDSENIVTNQYGRSLRVYGVLVGQEEHCDCAVIKIEHVPAVAQQSFPAIALPNSASLKFVGFPGTERQSSTPLKIYDGHVTDVRGELISFTIEGSPAKTAIDGMSGGGMYYIVNEYPFLVGVEFGMDSIRQDLQYGRIQCESLISFEEIINLNSAAPMVPAYLECFSRLKEYIFDFNVVDKNRVLNLKSALNTFADELIEQGMPPPFELMSKYKADLLVGPYQVDDVKNKDLWVAYFEFLIICAILDNVSIANGSYIESLERRRRILYTPDGSNWVGKLDLILKVARKLLDKNGIVIVTSPENGAELLPDDFEVDRVIRNIARIANSGPLAPIDQVEQEMYKSFVLTHLEGLRKKCVINKERVYAEVEAGLEQLQTFKESFNEFIK